MNLNALYTITVPKLRIKIGRQIEYDGSRPQKLPVFHFQTARPVEEMT